MSGRPPSRALPSRVELLACRFILLFILALQIDTVFFQHEERTPASIVVSSADHARWDSADPVYSKGAVVEGGWLLVAESLRSLTTATRVEVVEVFAAARSLPFTSTRTNEVLAARLLGDAVKMGRDASHSTTVPPPTL